MPIIVYHAKFIFDQLYAGTHPPPEFVMAYYAKHTWYHMMEYLFHTINAKHGFNKRISLQLIPILISSNSRSLIIFLHKSSY